MTEWTQQAVELVKQGHNKGKTYSQIAAEIGNGCSRSSVAGKIKRLGLPPSMVPRARTVLWCDQLDAKLIELFDIGLSYDVIGIELDRTRYAVGHRAGKLGLSRKLRTGPPAKAFVVAPRVRMPISYGSTLFVDSVEGQCKWPCWDDDTPADERKICGAEAIEGQPYCHTHCCVAFNNFGQKQRMPNVGKEAA